MKIVAWIHDKLTKRKMERVFSRREDPFKYHSSVYERDRFEKLTLALGDRHFEKILEVGCGEGIFTKSLALNAKEVLAVDISTVALDRAKKNLAGNSTPIRFIRGNIRDLIKKFESESFDLVVLSEVLYYLGEKKSKGVFFEAPFLGLLEQTKRILVKNGLILLAHGFGNDREREIREGYTTRLEDIGFLRLKRLFAGNIPHERGNMKSLIDLLEKK